MDSFGISFPEAIEPSTKLQKQYEALNAKLTALIASRKESADRIGPLFRIYQAGQRNPDNLRAAVAMFRAQVEMNAIESAQLEAELELWPQVEPYLTEAIKARQFAVEVQSARVELRRDEVRANCRTGAEGWRLNSASIEEIVRNDAGVRGEMDQLKTLQNADPERAAIRHNATVIGQAQTRLNRLKAAKHRLVERLAAAEAALEQQERDAAINAKTAEETESARMAALEKAMEVARQRRHAKQGV